MARKGSQKEKRIAVSGFVTEVELEDSVTGIVVNDGENDYLVVLDKKGIQLKDCIDEEVEVSGTLSENDGELWLKVNRFRQLDYFDDMHGDNDYDFKDDDRWTT